MDQAEIERAESEGMPPLPEPAPKQEPIAVATVCRCNVCNARRYEHSTRSILEFLRYGGNPTA
jgi:hypothetical protein